MIFGLDWKDGYLVSVHILDERGFGRWYPLRNFGDRQGDARIYQEEDCPKLTETEIKMTIRAYREDVKYERLGFRKYRKQ